MKLKGSQYRSLLETLLEAFPTVERWQVEAFLDLSPEAIEHLTSHGPASPR